jgi:hypothetical protein
MADLAHATANDTDLHGDFNARNWAERFASKFRIAEGWTGEELNIPDAVELMQTWFAGAIMTGHDVALSDHGCCGRDGEPHGDG